MTEVEEKTINEIQGYLEARLVSKSKKSVGGTTDYQKVKSTQFIIDNIIDYFKKGGDIYPEDKELAERVSFESPGADYDFANGYMYDF